MTLRPKAMVSWSSGKDSAWTLLRARTEARVEVVGLLTTVTEPFGRVSMHAVRRELLAAQASACGLPLLEVPIPWPCTNAIYEGRMREALGRAREQGVEEILFGDLFLDDVRAYREGLLAPTGVRGAYPLWGEDTTSLAREMIDGGLRALLTCVDPRQMDARLVGRAYDASLLRELSPGVDPCGENGEFHTFAYSGPMFSRSIACRVGEVVERDGFAFADVVSGEGPPASDSTPTGGGGRGR